MDSHVASKVASSSARVVALKADKRFLSAMNSHVVFQHFNSKSHTMNLETQNLKNFSNQFTNIPTKIQ